MSGDWAKVELSTPDKPEVWMIAESLGIDPDAAFGKVFRVWAWFDQHTENGNAPSVTKKLLDRLVGVTGFCNSMIQSGWMNENNDEISLPGFDKHNGASAKKRANTAKRVSQHRTKTESTGKDGAKGNDSDAKNNKDQEQKCNAQSVTSALAREEKRREYIKDNKNPTSENKFSDEHMAFAIGMFKLIRQVAPTAKEPNFEKWADDIRLINERDNRSLEEIGKVFRFANSDAFWKTNILSPGKLREKYTELHTKMINKQPSATLFDLTSRTYASGDL